MTNIIVIDLSNVTINGIPSGSVTDILVNHDPGITLNPDISDESGFRSSLQAALVSREDSLLLSHNNKLSSLSNAHAAELAKNALQQSEEINTIKNKHAEEIEAKTEELTQKDVIIADQKTQIDALGGTELGRQMTRKKQRNELIEQQKQLAAKLAEIDAGS